VVEFREKMPTVAALVGRIEAGNVGFQADSVSVSFHNELARYLPDVRLVPLGSELGSLRAIKDSLEIQHLEKVAALASEAFRGILSSIKPGVTEKEVALRLEFALRAAGADDKAFDFIVASGERGALPHGRASAKVIRSGELVTIDFGAVMDGYHSDETVTLALGEPDARQRAVYQTVKDAHDKALDVVRPGVALKALDAVARDHIAEKGYGKFFGHGLGHGVGLNVHEKPVVSFRSEDEAVEGMVFTIEPGIYIPGWGGVRIEDTVCVTADGCRLLTRVPKELTVL
jgi:Xaa-Pro aminopeptidase